MNKLIIILCFFPFIVLSQEKTTISGYIEEKINGEKLIGATVYDLKSGKGTITNDYGFYSLTLDKDSVRLRVSFSGFEINGIDYLELVIDNVTFMGTAFMAHGSNHCQVNFY